MSNGRGWLITLVLVVLFLASAPASICAQVVVPIPGINTERTAPADTSEATQTDTAGWVQMLSTMPKQDWFRLALSTLAILAIAYGIGKIIFIIARRFVKQTESSLDDSLLEALRPLIPWFLVAVGLQIATYRIGLSTEISTQALQHLDFLLYLVVAFVAGWRLIHYFAIWYQATISEGETANARSLIPLVQRTAQLGLILFAFLILLDHFEIRFVAVATALGLGGLAVSFAAKDTLSDIISGIIIIVDQPFRLGDRIGIRDADTLGDIVSIGLRSTHVRTPDNRTAIVPNSIIGNNLVINHTYPDLRIRVQSEVGLPYGIDISEGRRIVEQAVRTDYAVISELPVEVLFLNFGDSALIIRVRWWIESYIDKLQSLDKVNAAIYRGLNEAHIQVPYPQRDVHHMIDSDDLAYLSRLASSQPSPGDSEQSD